jgi:hypothetical protein
MLEIIKKIEIPVLMLVVGALLLFIGAGILRFNGIIA